MSESEHREYRNFRLLEIYGKIQKDPVLIDCMEKVFNWANIMGLKGKKVNSLTISEPSPNKEDKLEIWCKIEDND